MPRTLPYLPAVLRGGDRSLGFLWKMGRFSNSGLCLLTWRHRGSGEEASFHRTDGPSPALHRAQHPPRQGTKAWTSRHSVCCHLSLLANVFSDSPSKKSISSLLALPFPFSCFIFSALSFNIIHMLYICLLSASPDLIGKMILSVLLQCLGYSRCSVNIC